MPDSHLQCQNSIEEIRNHHESFPILLKNDFGYFTFWNKILILPAQTSSNKQSQTIFVPGIQYSESFKLVTKFPLVHIQQTQLLKNPIKATVYFLNLIVLFFFFSIWIFFHEHSRFTGQQEKREAISLAPYNHFHPLHRHLDISRAITTESSLLHIASSRTLVTFSIFKLLNRIKTSLEK